jgi:hypothetical protein
MSNDTPPKHRVEDEASDDPRRYEHNERPAPGDGETPEERAEDVAGRDHDVADKDSYEGGLPA